MSDVRFCDRCGSTKPRAVWGWMTVTRTSYVDAHLCAPCANLLCDFLHGKPVSATIERRVNHDRA